jgi:Ca2+:H+ antiporter
MTPAEPIKEKTTCKRIGFLIFKLGVIMTMFWALSDIIGNGIQDVCLKIGLTMSFTGFCILSMAGNIPEHWTAIDSAKNDNMDLAITIVISSALNILNFIIPLLVVVSYIGKMEPFTLEFDPVLLAIFGFSVLLLNKALEDKEIIFGEGVMKVAMYFIASAVMFATQ